MCTYHSHLSHPQSFVTAHTQGKIIAHSMSPEPRQKGRLGTGDQDAPTVHVPRPLKTHVPTNLGMSLLTARGRSFAPYVL